jgi:phage protein D
MPESVPTYKKRDSINLFIRVREGSKYFDVDLSQRLINMVYTDSEKKFDDIVLTVDNFDLYFFDNPVFRPGNIIEATWGYPGNMAPTRRLCIHKMSGNTRVKVEAKGGATLMAEKQRTDVYENCTPEEVARIIAARNGYGQDIRFIEESFVEPRTYHQAGRTDAQMVHRVANRVGFQFYIDFDGFHFHKRKMNQDPVREITYYTDRSGHIISFNISENIFGKKRAVKVSGKDPDTKKPFSVTSTTSTSDKYYTDGFSSYYGSAIDPEDRLLSSDEPEAFIPKADPTAPPGEYTVVEDGALADAAAAAGIAKNRYVSFPIKRVNDVLTSFVDSAGNVAEQIENLTQIAVGDKVEVINADVKKKEAKALANARFRKYVEKTVEMSMTVVGDPGYLAKTTILVSGMGKRLSGKYYVEEVVHNLGTAGGYTCSLSLKADGDSGWKKTAFDQITGNKQTRRGGVSKKLTSKKPSVGSLFDSSLELSQTDQLKQTVVENSRLISDIEKEVETLTRTQEEFKKQGFPAEAARLEAQAQDLQSQRDELLNANFTIKDQLALTSTEDNLSNPNTSDSVEE